MTDIQPTEQPWRDVLVPTDVARMYGVDPKTVIRWANDGKIRCFRTPGGHRRFHRADIEADIAASTAADK